MLDLIPAGKKRVVHASDGRPDRKFDRPALPPGLVGEIERVLNDTRAVTPSEDPQDDRPLHVAGAGAGDVVASEPAPSDALAEVTSDAEPAMPAEPEDLEPDPAEHVPGAGAGDVVASELTSSDAPADVPSDVPADLVEAAATFTPSETDADRDSDEEDAQEPSEPPRVRFSDLGLSEELVRAVEEKGYLHPTPIQEQAIPYVLMGRDVLGVAQTGTGKTAGFTLPLLDILSGSRARARMPRSLILEPTRELALQVAENFVDYGRYLKLNHALLIGGESMSDQKEALAKGVDVLIATPGRLLDLFERGGLMLNDTKILVIDEADRMLDMGFIPDVERIASLISSQRQTLFFSATMAPEIKRLADAFLLNPKLITVSRAASVATTIVAGLALVDEAEKRRALRSLLNTEDVANALIFCNRKRDVDILAKSLAKHDFSVGALHGDLPQSVRFSTLEGFKAGNIRLLVCSDVAARGIDIGGLSHVFNFDVPIHAEDYVHRIGRTGRAGRTGHAYTIAAPDDRLLVDAIEKLTGAPIPRMNVPDVETATWSEIDGRKRRGRRGGKPSAKTGAEPAAARAPSPAREPRPARPAPVAAALAPLPAPAPRERDRERDRGDRDRPRDRDRDRDAPREPRRDYPRRQEDLGPPVLAFGDATPDFMLLARRLAPVTTELDLLDTEEFTLPDEPAARLPAIDPPAIDPPAIDLLETIDESGDQATENVAPSDED